MRTVTEEREARQAQRQAEHRSVQHWLETAVARLVRELEPEQILLFGSFARGTATRRSDIDLCLVWDTKLPPLERIGKVLTLLKDAPRPVEAVAYTPDDLTRMSTSPFVRRIQEEGKVLYERREAAA